MSNIVLRLDASARTQGSITRDLADETLNHLRPDRVLTRDLLATPIPHLTAQWLDATFTNADERSDGQRETLALSDTLIDEVKAADTLLIGVPIYNFSIPSALKAWIDHVARAGVTFAYSADGPKGLLTGKKAILVVASGGTAVGSGIDHATGYLRHVLGFIGITDVTIVSADQMALDAKTSLQKAQDQISELAA